MHQYTCFSLNFQDNGFDECLIDSDWYVLPRELQGYIECLINRQQNVAGLSIGPFGADLNRFTFKTVRF